MKILVGKDENEIIRLKGTDKFSQCFTSVSEALEFAKSHDEIHILPGIYNERVTIKTPHLKIYGSDSESTVITFNLGAFDLCEDGSKRGTFRSYTMFIDAHDIYMEGLTIENSAGDGRKVGQALALYAEGEGLKFRNCRFLGHQDTIFTGPLPDEAVNHGGFVGPKENAERINGRQWYDNCYIEGDVDFIFGGASVFFSNCTICSLNRDMDVNGYVTAPSTPKGQKYGYVFDGCDFVSKDCKPDTVYISRPWREYGQAVFVNCNFGSHIKKEFVHDWNKPIAHETAYYAEYPKVTGREDWVKALMPEDLNRYSLQSFFE